MMSSRDVVTWRSRTMGGEMSGHSRTWESRRKGGGVREEEEEEE